MADLGSVCEVQNDNGETTSIRVTPSSVQRVLPMFK